MQPLLSVLAEGEKEHIIYGPASVEIRDSEGEIIKAEALEDALPQLIRRGRFSKQHADIIVGEILPLYKDSTGKIWKTEVRYPNENDMKMFPYMHKDAASLFAVGNVYGDSFESQNIRKLINEGKFNSFSISGTKLSGGMGEVNKMDLDAITICERGANPDAKFTSIAKSQDKAEHVSKPCGGYGSFNACVAANGDKSDPEAYCAAILHSVEKLDKEYNKEVHKMPDDATAPQQPPAAPAEATAQTVVDVAGQIAELATKLEAIVADVAQLKQASAPKPPEPPKEEKPPEKPEDKPEKKEEEVKKEAPVEVKKEEVKVEPEHISKELRIEKAETPRPNIEPQIEEKGEDFKGRVTKVLNENGQNGIKKFLSAYRKEVLK